MANNLRKNSGAIPGIRPGKPTADFIAKILSRITLIGALFLSVVAILPIIVGNVGGIQISLGRYLGAHPCRCCAGYGSECGVSDDDAPLQGLP